LPHASAWFCDALTGGRLRPSHGPGATRAQRRGNDADLHAATESWAARGAESAGGGAGFGS
jgi:hypothetical protein